VGYLLDISGLSVVFETDEGRVQAVDNVSFGIGRGEALGLVGESGCGKSVTAMSLLRLIPSPPGRILSGRVRFGNVDLLSMPLKDLRRIRGRDISVIFQEPMTALSPLHRVGHQLVEGICFHGSVSRREARAMSEAWLRRVGLPDPARQMHAYPFQLSGGMRQRVMIGMALMLEPALIIADEPTTALDVTIQAQVFDLMREMRSKHTSLLLITHDMGVIWEMCTRVVVMYASEIVEIAAVQDLFRNPLHPYAEALLKAVPGLTGTTTRLPAIPGTVPMSESYVEACRFHDRCPYAFDRCGREHPPLYEVNGRTVRCFLRDPS
jgi:oligopeptide/dipeptide ABC transporter ATP-binding protein